MRVAVLGVGGLGRTLVRLLRSDPQVEQLLLIDRSAARLTFLVDNRSRVRVEIRPIEVNNSSDLSRVLRGWDVAVNTLPPKHNLSIMRGCLEAGAHYLDMAASGPREPGGLPGIFEQLTLHETFQKAGVRALVGMGLDPGMSNVLARDASAPFESIAAIRIRSGGTARLPGNAMQNFPLYSRETFLEDVLLPPSIWSDEGLCEREPLSEPEDYPFPAPVGVQRAFLVSHEEVKTLPHYLGKPVHRVDFKQAYDPALIQAVISLSRLGALAGDRTVVVAGQRVPFWRLFLDALPEPSTIVQPIEGAKALSVEVEGTVGGATKVARRDIVMSHRETSLRASITAVVYLTAEAAAIGVAQLMSPRFPGAGVFPSESLDPAAVLAEWSARKLPVAASERTIAA